MNKQLFSEFDAVSAKALKQKIQYDLKGADYNDTLTWQSPEGIDVKPVYHREDLPKTQDIPGMPEAWSVGVAVFVKNERAAGKAAKQALQKGAESIVFTADEAFDVHELFRFVEEQELPENSLFYFDCQFLDENFAATLMDFAAGKKIPISLDVDIIGNLARSGNWFYNLKEDFELLSRIISAEKPAQNRLVIDTTIYQNAGANIVQQLAYGLAHANEYLNRFEQSLSDQALTFKVAIGSNYFFEIAKLRALRILYAELANLYDLPQNCHILAFPTRRNKTVYEYNTNLLRTTTETMSAVLGGADTVVNLPYDALYHKTNDFGERISRNQLLLLKEEAYFDAVTDAGAGSYYIETLTQQLAESALKLFKQIEKSGGFLKALKSHKIQEKIKESAALEQQRFDDGDKVLLGINKHPDADQQMQQELELYPFVKHNPRKTLIQPIIPIRLAEQMEKQRLDREKSSNSKA
ncbi:MAG: methylmalonyl-CoA mutase subunit beta [Leeuwenhoekiella sp.]